ncbi:WD40-repeat-containing domain protein [Emericellopsis atlantica]|uniref:WD40-repeat-containing domain protein n=1 Tax=Emericellopsis atlantica TaxID=2614577 RepID=A0A9P7ZT40_9HYPO|nr:WD40-repeat-containing domain protein [Emericellopsis atlantica]KAG9257770.1 WD40-repeat-containing domain protein [Emericellopsis atlantica]
MDVRRAISTSVPDRALSAAFNQNRGCFSVGLETGVCNFNGGFGLVQMLGTSQYMALVGGGKSPKFAINKAIIWDQEKGKVVTEISALEAVRNVQLNRQKIVVVLQHSARVYAFSKKPNLLHAYETADNQGGLCCLTNDQLVIPGRTSGQVQIVELATGNVSIIPAHSSALRALQVSPDGELLATASETGTLIRIFSTANCAKLAELRRGVDPATIFSLDFSPSSTLLACTSDKSTLHVFDVPHPRKPNSYKSNQQREAEGKWGFIGKLPMMPRVFSDVYSFASTTFESGDELVAGGIIPATQGNHASSPRPAKGLIGWIEENALIVVGTGYKCRWEKFMIGIGEDGKRTCYREGWKPYHGQS